MNFKITKKFKIVTVILFGILCLFLVWEIFVPQSFSRHAPVVYHAQKGASQKDIAKDLQAQGVIKSSFFFRLYSFISGNYAKLQAGLYDFSPSMSIAGIIGRLAAGDIMKNRIVILEGWDTEDLSQYLESKGIYSQADFLDASKKDFSKDFPFLKTKKARVPVISVRPKNATLEGYLFPDSYVVPADITPQDFLKVVLANFDKKLTPDLRLEIAKQHKTIFQIITMASILEKEVRSLDDKKIVAGILWKRIYSSMPLQVDATINYVTGKSDVSVALEDTKIDSRYNTYKYFGLPAGPISNPGMNSILAAMYPTHSDYWYYLSASATGKTLYSRTFADHAFAISKYLK